MSKYSRGLMMAMEADALEPVDMTSLDTADYVDDLAESDRALGEDARDIEDDFDMMQEAFEDMDALDDINDVLADSVDDGEGLSDDAAEMAQIAVESIYRRLGMRAQNPIPSLESFGGRSARVQATRVAMESIGQSLKKAGEAIWKFFSNLIDKLRAAYQKWRKAMDDKQRDKERKELTDAIKMIERNKKTPRNTKIDNKVLVKNLGFVQGDITESTFMEMMRLSSQLTQGVKSFYDEVAKTNIIVVKKAMEDKMNDEGGTRNFERDIGELKDDIVKKITSSFYKDLWKPTYAGGVKLKVTEKLKISPNGKSLGTFPVSLGEDIEVESTDGNKVILVPEHTRDLVGLHNAMIKFCDDVNRVAVIDKELGQFQKLFNAEINKYMKAAQHAHPGDEANAHPDDEANDDPDDKIDVRVSKELTKGADAVKAFRDYIMGTNMFFSSLHTKSMSIFSRTYVLTFLYLQLSVKEWAYGS